MTARTVLITGAGRGIGAACARHFAALGDRVVLFGRHEATLQALAAEIGPSALVTPGDVAVYADVERAVAAALARFGRLDVLINNAGVIEPIAHIADSDPDAWGRVVDVNLKGAYHAMRACLPPMLEAGGGTIINLSSGAATKALEGWSHYCATKAALLSLTATAHLEYSAQGIRVVGLSPGTVATDMQGAIRASGINPVSRLDPGVHIPADWVARATSYLCGPGGARFAGVDFSLRSDESRRALGLPPSG